MYFSGISVLILVIYVALAAALAWALVLWLIVGHRWLSLHPKSGKSVQLPVPDASPPPPPPSA